MRVRWSAVGVAAVLCVSMTLALAAPKIETLKPGATVPDFKLKDSTGKEHTLGELKGKVVVLEFSSPSCPWSRATDPHIAELATSYAGKDVVFLGVDSNNGVTPEDLKKHAEENKIPFPILKDEGNDFADAVGAKQTPEMFVVDKDGKLAYHGAYDNRKTPEAKGDTNFVSAAVDALLAGKEVEKKEEKTWGCGIKRAR